MAKYFGKYRGIVTENLDPKKLGRLQVQVPEFEGMKETWCLPCAPYAGKGVGFYTIPPKQAHVWVEFEAGNLDRPIWSGCFWADTETPLGDKITPDKKVFKTETITMILDDTVKENAGGFTLDIMPESVKTRLTVIGDKTGLVLTCYGTDKKAASTVTMTPDNIVIDHPTAKITLDKSSIVVTVPKAEIKMTADKIASSVQSGKVEISASAVNSSVGAIKEEISNSGITLTATPTTATVAAAGAVLKNAANSVNVSSASVAINQTALVVI